MSVGHSNRRGMYYGTWRELPGVILGLVLYGVLVGISWYLGYAGYYYLGDGGLVLGITGSGFAGYLYSALNRKRKFDIVIAVMVIAYLIFAYFVELYFPLGQMIVNIAIGSSLGFAVEILSALLILLLLGAAFFYAKRTDVR